MTLSRVSVTNATHRAAWCKIGQVERTSLNSARNFAESHCGAAPRRPHNALSNPLQSFSQRSPPPEPWKLNAVPGRFTGGRGHCTITDPLRHGLFWRSLALYRRRLVLLLLEYKSYETLYADASFVSSGWQDRWIQMLRREERSTIPEHNDRRSYLTRLVDLIIIMMILWLHFNKSPPGFSKQRKTKADALSYPRLVSFA